MLLATLLSASMGCSGSDSPSTAQLQQQVAQSKWKVAALERRLLESENARVAILENVNRLSGVEQELAAIQSSNENLKVDENLFRLQALESALTAAELEIERLTLELSKHQ